MSFVVSGRHDHSPGARGDGIITSNNGAACSQFPAAVEHVLALAWIFGVGSTFCGDDAGYQNYISLVRCSLRHSCSCTHHPTATCRGAGRKLNSVFKTTPAPYELNGVLPPEHIAPLDRLVDDCKGVSDRRLFQCPTSYVLYLTHAANPRDTSMQESYVTSTRMTSVTERMRVDHGAEMTTLRYGPGFSHGFGATSMRVLVAPTHAPHVNP